MSIQNIISVFKQIFPLSRVITLTNFVMASSLIWMAGSLTAKIVEKKFLEIPPKKVVFEKPKSDTKSGSQKLTTFDAIIKNNVFDAEIRSKPIKKEPVVEKKPETIAPASDKLKKIISDLSLIGVYRGRSYYSIIKHKRTNKEDLFGINDEIFDTGAIVVKIYAWKTRNEVHIQLNGEIGKLEYIKDDHLKEQAIPKNNQQTQKRPIQRAKPTINKPSVKNNNQDQSRYSSNGTDFYLRSAEVEKHIADFPTLLNQAKVVPHLVNGKSEGYTIKYIDKGSLYEKLGLKNYDIIKKVNGQEINSIEKAMFLFNTLKNEREITINIMRNNQPISLNYHIN